MPVSTNTVGNNLLIRPNRDSNPNWDNMCKDIFMPKFWVKTFSVALITNHLHLIPKKYASNAQGLGK